MDRARRLIEALPAVPRALASAKVFRDEAGNTWNALRRGLTDLKKEPEKLSTIELPADDTIASVWEFMLKLMVESPKYARQILDAVDFLLSSERWAKGFLETKGLHRLSLWKLKASANSEPSPVSLAVRIIDMGVDVDDLLPVAALESGLDFVEDLSKALKGRAGSDFHSSQLGRAWKEARQAKELEIPTGSSLEDLGDLAAANQVQADSIAAAGTTERRPGCRKDIVDSLLDAFEGAVDLTEMHLKPMMSGYDGEANVATSAKERIVDLQRRQADLQAQLVIMGPCQAGKTSLTYALVGFAALPPALPSMVTTRWVHTPGLAVPRMTMPEELAKLLGTWAAKLVASPDSSELEGPSPLAAKGEAVEGIDAVAGALEAVHRTIHRCRTLGIVSAEELAALCRPSLYLQVEVAFSPLADLEGELTDTGLLSLVDLPSPDTETLWETQDAQALCRAALREADGALVVIDASKYEVPQWMGGLLREAFAQETGGLRRDDAWIVANRIDQLPEFFCKDGPKDVCKKVSQRQYRNHKDVIVSEDHVIPISARLSLLAMYGREKVREPLSAQLVARFDRQPWFAQLCSLIFGIQWMTKVQDLEQTKWRNSMRELHLMGQVTGPLATSVLKTAYVKMLPHSVERVMLELSLLVSSFCSALHNLDGTSATINVETLNDVFQAFFQDVQQRVKQCFQENAPGIAETTRLADQKCPNGDVIFDGPDSTELHQKYFELLAREALQTFHPFYGEALKKCMEQVVIAHNKYLRSLDYYLQKDGVDPFAKQKLLLDAKNVAFVQDTASASPLPNADRDRIVKESVKKGHVEVRRQLFQRSQKTYKVTTDSLLEFVKALLEPWLAAAESEVERRCLKPLQKAQDELRQAMEEHNRQREKGARRRKESSKIDFSFAPKLAEVLKNISTFRSMDAAAAEEAERCEQVCQEIRSTLQEIEKKN